MTRTVYLVKTKDGYLGYRRGGYRDNQARGNATFEHARVYARRQDAEAVMDWAGGEVVEATLALA